MKILRIVAHYVQNGVEDKDFKFIILCGVDESWKIVEADWFGCHKDHNDISPFLFNGKDKFIYSSNEFNITNLGEKTIKLKDYKDNTGANDVLFTVSYYSDSILINDTFKIISCIDNSEI